MIEPAHVRRRVWIAGLACAALPGSAGAQAPAGSPDSVPVVLGPDYEASDLRRLLWGDHYRAAWTSTIELPVLDLAGFAGGLTPERAAGGTQTASLVLRGGDGRGYVFRLVDKDPTRGLSRRERGEPIVEFLQDQVSSLHPFALVVADELEDAAGVAHPDPTPLVMPDDPALGGFRDAFAGRVGMFSERVTADADSGSAFGGFVEVVDGEDILERLATRDERIEATAFLEARLVDLLVGDWNRHWGQWFWGRRSGSRTWEPIALDRDHAFSRRDGIVPSAARFFVRGFVGFADDYSSVYDLHHVSREIDRRLLAGLARPTWDSVARAVQSRLPDRVIEAAVRRLPEPLFALDGEVLLRSLRLRRDRLPEAAGELYALLADVPEIHLTDRSDRVRITALSGGAVEVTAESGRVAGGRPSSPRFSRLFFPSETSEIRVFLGAGDDLVEVASAVSPRGARSVRRGSPTYPRIRVIGGEGDDEVAYGDDALPVRFYDAAGENRVSGLAPSRAIAAERYEPRSWWFGPRRSGGTESPIEWGGWAIPGGAVDFSGDFGLFVGLGVTRYDYGFRRYPYGRRLRLLGGVSTTGRLHVEYESDVRHEASARHFTLRIVASELDVVNFFGLGNDSRPFATSDSADAARRALSVRPRLGSQLTQHLDVGVGVELALSSTNAARNPFLTPIPDSLPQTRELVLGARGYERLGLFADARLDTRDDDRRPRRGWLVESQASFQPGLFDVGTAYWSFEAEAATYLTPAGWPRSPTFAFRAGGRKVWGDFPYFDAAILGGRSSVRGFASDRFAGDLALYGSAELRLPLLEPRILFLGQVGAIGFADVGRVWLDGETPGGWHAGYGGGLWITPLGVEAAVSVLWAKSDETTRLYLYFGMPF